jgi:hypothetical protein
MPATPDFTPDFAPFLNLPLTDLLEVLTDQLEIALNGGQSTDDSPYPRTFLRLCMEEAKDKLTADTETANLAILQQDYLTRKKDEQESYFMDLKAKTEYWETPERWLQAFPVKFLFDNDRGQYYFILPQVLVMLRRYQNLPAETGIWDIQARNVQLRQKYRFAKGSVGVNSYQRSPGGSLGRFMFRTERNMAIDTATEQSRCYLDTPKFDTKIPDEVQFDAYAVVREDRTSGLPPAALKMVTQFDMVRMATEIAMLRTRQDKLVDASPSPTTTVQ